MKKASLTKKRLKNSFQIFINLLNGLKKTLIINSIDIGDETKSKTIQEGKTAAVSSFTNWIEDKSDLSLSLDNAAEEFTEEQKTNFRTDKNYNKNDRKLERDINGAIVFTQGSYDKMSYRNALKYGFVELQLAGDNYRMLCLELGTMNLCLVKRFIEVQAILLAPICDYIYQFLHPETSIMSAKWPSN